MVVFFFNEDYEHIIRRLEKETTFNIALEQHRMFVDRNLMYTYTDTYTLHHLCVHACKYSFRIHTGIIIAYWIHVLITPLILKHGKSEVGM